jgi:hypothetical protein
MIKTKTMDKELKTKLESKKSDGKKKKGCTTCKKKKEVITTLPEVEEFEVFYIPTNEEIHLAYVELGNRVEDKSEFINKVYKALFDEDFNFGCKSCVNAQARRLRNYIIEVLKIEI